VDSPDRWRRIKDLFSDAVSRGPAERAAFLADACGADEALRREVESLLEGHDQAGEFLDRRGPARMPSQIRPELGSPVVLTTVAGHELLQELGRGGMGIVYRAFDRKRRREVALKTLQYLSPSTLYRFKQEFRTLADVTHPNLVQLYDLTADGQNWFFTMQLVHGGDFLAYVRGGNPAAIAGPASPEQVSRLRAALPQLAAGVAALHDAGKLHRDLKPSNVLVRADGHVVVLDFGLAAEAEPAGRERPTGDVFGTLDYMAPERFAGAGSPASDWYSVGVMLYEALTGRRPFAGSLLDVMTEKRIEPTPPRELDPAVPSDLDQLCVDLLRRSPEHRPSGRDVIERLGGRRATVAAADIAAAPRAPIFVGRGSQLNALEKAFDAVASGRTVCLLVQGRSGSGKTALVRQFLHELRRRPDVVVLAGRCYDREVVPYKGLDSVMDALSRYLLGLPALETQALLPRDVHLLTRVFPVLERVEAVARAPGRAVPVVDPNEITRRAFGALRELLGRLGDRKRVILFIDDLQWGDAESARHLVDLLRPPDSPPLLLIGCYRREDSDTSGCIRVLGELAATAAPPLDWREVALEPLSPAESRDLALALLGGDLSADLSAVARSAKVEAGTAKMAAAQAEALHRVRAENIARESGGNPFFIHELVHRADEDSERPRHAGEGEGLTLDRVLWDRIARLPDPALRLLAVVAISGRPLGRASACYAAAFDTDYPDAIAALRAARLIRTIGPADEEELEAYHDRIRETVLAHLSPVALQTNHRILALTLEAGPDANREAAGGLDQLPGKRRFELAYHFDASGDSRRALPHALAAAEQARSQHALGIAEQQYRIAERGAEDDATRCRVAEGLGDVLMLAGRYEEAAERLLAARALARDSVTQARIEGKRGELAFKRGDMTSAVEPIERALRLLEWRVPRSTPGFLLALLWEIGVQAVHTWAPRRTIGRRALREGATDLLAVRFYSSLAYAYWFRRGKIPCLWSHLRALNVAERYPPTEELAHAYSSHGPALTLVGWFSRAIAYLEKSLQIRTDLGNVWGRGQSLHFYGVVLYTASRFNDCIDKCREAVALLEQTGDPWELNIARWQIAGSLYRLGRLPEAADEAKRIHHDAIKIGDAPGAGMSLDVWARATLGHAPPGAIQTELQRAHQDGQRGAMLWLAEGVRLCGAGHWREAAAAFESGHHVAEAAGVRNTYVLPLLPWLATACREDAETNPQYTARERDAVRRRARAAAATATRRARRFQNDLPHALREAARLDVSLGRLARARKRFDESLSVADRHGARYEHAQTLLARGRAGQTAGWPEAAEDIAAAEAALAEILANVDRSAGSARIGAARAPGKPDARASSPPLTS
jgi:tetratricopeptide (TPR) repeat protein